MSNNKEFELNQDQKVMVNIMVNAMLMGTMLEIYENFKKSKERKQIINTKITK